VLHNLSLALAPALSRTWEVSSLFIDHVALAVHTHLLSAYGPGVRRPGPRTGLLAWQQRRVKELIETRLDGRLSLRELAAECRMSTSHFSRAFQRSTGQSPHQWLLDRRVDHAKRLLAEREPSLAQIAKICGFADLSHLSRVFLARSGTTPGAWRRGKRA
jgi:AraC-like DNA-binding protein